VRAALIDPGLAVLQAEPGAGKTTVVPLRLLDEPWLEGRKIVILEPRRVAARAAARRMSDLVGQSVGDLVGVRTRDDTRVGPHTRIEVVTEGVLTRRLQHEPSLDDVGLVVFDEFHERSLVADLGLALALEARAALRPDLRLLVMSATLEADRVARLLGGDDDPAPQVLTRGRVHPVAVTWRPRAARDPLEPAAAAAVREVVAAEPGDVLVFLPGAAAIRRTARLLSGLRDPEGEPVAIRPLYGALRAAEQDRALAPDPSGRKVVLATDIAETSLTVEGVRSVVDSGLARTPRYDPGTGMTRLVTISVSRASAEQRAGRAGRTAPGRAVRLWSEAEHAVRRGHADPEITQVDLAGLVLEAAVWGERDPSRLALLDRPPEPAVLEARDLLREAGAIDAEGAPTRSGRVMADLPLHPRLASVVLTAVERGEGWTGCLIAAVLEERDIMRGRLDDRPTDLTVRLQLVNDPDRDHPAADRDSRSRVRRRARDLARRVRVRPGPVAVDAVGSLLLAGFPDRVAQRRGDRRGRFRLRSGAGAFVSEEDVLAGEDLIVAADTDGDRRDARVRLAAGIDRSQVEAAFEPAIEQVRTVAWDDERDDLVLTVESRLGALSFARHQARPEAGPDTVEALVERVRETELEALPWKADTRTLQARVGFVRAHDGPDRWPDLGDEALLGDLDEWLAPMLVGARSRSDLDRLDLLTTLRARLGWDRMVALDRLAPERLALPSGRAAAVAYGDGRPVIRARVQELYGASTTPTVLDGRQPVVFELTSPADRPIQVTDDLVGFWAGSWTEVRKEMAGRYPKHDWPVDPAGAKPSGPGGRRRR
jgi:ATP-dependent helicase HrpB